jgi:hypothetical protein
MGTNRDRGGWLCGNDREAALVTGQPAPAGRLDNPDAVLSRTDLRDLGYERRAVDAIFRACPVVALPGYRRPLIRVADFRAFLREHTYADDRVRPT